MRNRGDAPPHYRETKCPSLTPHWSMNQPKTTPARRVETVERGVDQAEILVPTSPVPHGRVWVSQRQDLPVNVIDGGCEKQNRDDDPAEICWRRVPITRSVDAPFSHGVWALFRKGTPPSCRGNSASCQNRRGLARAFSAGRDQPRLYGRQDARRYYVEPRCRPPPAPYCGFARQLVHHRVQLR